jgi:hypothetical protein
MEMIGETQSQMKTFCVSSLDKMCELTLTFVFSQNTFGIICFYAFWHENVQSN